MYYVTNEVLFFIHLLQGIIVMLNHFLFLKCQHWST